jgi:hypothetical protein
LVLASRPLALLMMGHPHIGAHVDTIENPLAPLTFLVDFKP